jgi:hypothetical protein
MATYNLWVTNAVIQQIRSNDQDTLVASTWLQVTSGAGTPHNFTIPEQTVNFGTRVTGDTVNMYNLLFQNIDVPDPILPDEPDGGSISWTFLLANAGAGNMPTIVGDVTNIVNAVTGALTVIGPIGAAVSTVAKLVDTLTADLLTGCDGIVASQNWVFSAKELAQMTSGEMGWSTTQNYPGSQSPMACGARSSYDVSYAITAKPAVRVPTLAGKSPQEAAQLATRAGLTMDIVRDVPSSNTGGPTVDGSQPAAGALVPFGTVLDVVVLVPAGGGGPGGGGPGGGPGGGGHHQNQ